MVEIEHFRPGTTDDRYVIPELIGKDMYRIKRLAKRIRKLDGPVIDGGAHIGVFTTLMAEHTQRTIHAFEPAPANFELLKKNTGRFSNRVVCHAKALAPEAGTVRLTEQEGNPGNYRSEAGGDVEAISLPAFVRECCAVALLKLDLEGAEAAIVNRMDEADLRRIGVLVLEEHDEPIDHARLKRIGFKLDFRPLRNRRHAVYVRRS